MTDIIKPSRVGLQVFGRAWTLYTYEKTIKAVNATPLFVQ